MKKLLLINSLFAFFIFSFCAFANEISVKSDLQTIRISIKDLDVKLVKLDNCLQWNFKQSIFYNQFTSQFTM